MAAVNKDELSTKHEIFARVLAETGNQSEAFRAMCPYTKSSDKSIWQQSSRIAKLLKVSSRVKEYKAEFKKKAENEFDISAGRVLLEISRLAFNDPRKAFDENGNLLAIKDWPDEVAAAISSIKLTEIGTGDNAVAVLKEVKFWDKGKQIELAARRVNLFEKELETPASALAKVLSGMKDSTGLPIND